MSGQVACCLCGTTVPAPAPLTWSRASGPRGTTHLCERCTRDNLRALEAKLDQEHW